MIGGLRAAFFIYWGFTMSDEKPRFAPTYGRQMAVWSPLTAEEAIREIRKTFKDDDLVYSVYIRAEKTDWGFYDDREGSTGKGISAWRKRIAAWRNKKNT